MNTRIKFIVYSPIVVLYKLITDFCLKSEIPASTNIGTGLIVHHVTGIVLNAEVVIGENCTLNHNITVGNKVNDEGLILGTPVIGDNVIIGPHSVIIGPISIGSNVSIGAGTVVVKNVPDNAVVAGNPARIIRFKS